MTQFTALSGNVPGVASPPAHARRSMAFALALAGAGLAASAGLIAPVQAQDKVLNLYSARHYQTDEALYAYTLALKARFLRSAESPVKVVFDNHLQVTANALGSNGHVPRIQGKRIKSKREIRVASVFKEEEALLMRIPASPRGQTGGVARSRRPDRKR